ncbi:MAG: PAP/fibrillin family protein [Aphanothece sp. CMT-3BRIN-NPC111]|nr:PAP/fibrillin family protein [Aphanothece sp. CMT-3BRIN-NPC111]
MWQKLLAGSYGKISVCKGALTTSYLDQEIRVERGATGNLFVFRRE